MRWPVTEGGVVVFCVYAIGTRSDGAGCGANDCGNGAALGG